MVKQLSWFLPLVLLAACSTAPTATAPQPQRHVMAVGAQSVAQPAARLVVKKKTVVIRRTGLFGRTVIKTRTKTVIRRRG